MSRRLDDLEKVREIVEKQWCVGHFEELKTGNVCLDGAIMKAVGMNPTLYASSGWETHPEGGRAVGIARTLMGEILKTPSGIEMMGHLKRSYGCTTNIALEEPQCYIPGWNDRYATKRDVLDVCCGAIRTVAEEEGVELVAPTP